MVWTCCTGFKASTRRGSSSNLRRLSLNEEFAVAPACSTVPLASTSQAGSLVATRCNSIGSSSAGSPLILQQSIRDRLRHRSLPTMHLLEERATLLDSCAMMANPPVFDNPLRRRGCCNHDHSQLLASYRAEAIERELRVKQINCGERAVMAAEV